MKPFPGTLKRKEQGFVLTKPQIKWLSDVYPTNTNKDICKVIGINSGTLPYIIKRQCLHLAKDRDWLVYERCKQMHKVPIGCGKEHDISIQKFSTITIATKLSKEDYMILREAAKKSKKTKYEFIQDAIRKYIKENA